MPEDHAKSPDESMLADFKETKRQEIPVFDSIQSKQFFDGLANACHHVPRMQADLSVDQAN